MNRHDLICLHSSDLHLGVDSGEDWSFTSRTWLLGLILRAVEVLKADLLVIAGDLFDNNRQTPRLINEAASMMGTCPVPIVILPGNHDPLTRDSVYRRTAITSLPNVSVLGLTAEERVVFPSLSLEVCGRAHRRYADMTPLCRPPSRSARWQIVTAHGHYVEDHSDHNGSWLIRPGDLCATGADYIALGHWNRSERVGGVEINAYYSGAPDVAGTVNRVLFRSDGSVVTRLAPLMPAVGGDAAGSPLDTDS